MIVSKKDFLSRLIKTLRTLNTEELLFLYDKEFRKVKSHRSVIFKNNKMFIADSNEEITTDFIIEFIIKELAQENQNYNASMIFNTIHAKTKSKYLGNKKFEIEEKN